MTSPRSGRSAEASAVLDLDRAWALHPQVSVRPEPFGALLYHFGTRQLSFLKDRRLLNVVNALGSSPSALAACAAAGLREDELPRYARALATLARSSMLVEEADSTDRTMVNP
jgi:putative mycofactocin binding protein MftB